MNKIALAYRIVLLTFLVIDAEADVSISGKVVQTFTNTAASFTFTPVTASTLQFSSSEDLGNGMTVFASVSYLGSTVEDFVGFNYDINSVQNLQSNLTSTYNNSANNQIYAAVSNSAVDFIPNATFADFDAVAKFHDGTASTFVLPTIIGNFSGNKTGSGEIYYKQRNDSTNEIFISNNQGYIEVTGKTNGFENIATSQDTSMAISSIALHGAHHQPLLAQRDLGTDNCTWINGDFANYHKKSAESYLLEIGICSDIKEDVRIGLGVGKSRVHQSLDYSGSSKLNGDYLLGELDYMLPDTSILLSSTLLYGRWDATVNRGYRNADVDDLSHGSTDIEVAAVRGRIDWMNLFAIDEISFTPKVEYIITKSSMNGYTETGGGFPALFNAQAHTARESRIGFIADYKIDESIDIRGIGEWVHRLDKRGVSVSGEMIDMYTFSFQGAENRSDWLRVGAEVDHKIDKERMFSWSLMRASRGEDADLSGAVSFKMGF